MSREGSRHIQFAKATNQAAATRYYPDANGWDVSTAERVSIMGTMVGGITWTIEASLYKDGNDSAIVAWEDISNSFVNLATAASGTASWVDDAILLLQLNNLNVERLRVKEVTSDTSNVVQGWIKVV